MDVADGIDILTTTHLVGLNDSCHSYHIVEDDHVPPAD